MKTFSGANNLRRMWKVDFVNLTFLNSRIVKLLGKDANLT